MVGIFLPIVGNFVQSMPTNNLGITPGPVHTSSEAENRNSKTTQSSPNQSLHVFVDFLFVFVSNKFLLYLVQYAQDTMEVIRSLQRFNTSCIAIKRFFFFFIQPINYPLWCRLYGNALNEYWQDTPTLLFRCHRADSSIISVVIWFTVRTLMIDKWLDKHSFIYSSINCNEILLCRYVHYIIMLVYQPKQFAVYFKHTYTCLYIYICTSNK